jgi:hypothetical protein
MARYNRISLTREGVAAIKARVKRGERWTTIAPDYHLSSGALSEHMRRRYGVVGKHGNTQPDKKQGRWQRVDADMKYRPYLMAALEAIT